MPSDLAMEDYSEGIDDSDAMSRCSDCGGSDDLTDDFDRQELEWALYSQIHHEEADDSNAHSKSWLEQECDISIKEDGDTSKNGNEQKASTPKPVRDNILLSSDKTIKKKKTLEDDNKKTSKESRKKPSKENKRKSSKEGAIKNLEALLVQTPKPSKITSVSKKHNLTEDSELSKHCKKQKSSDKSQKVDETTDIQLNINDPREEYDSNTVFDNKHVTVEDVHKSLGDCDWDLINADVWKTGPATVRVKSRYYRSNVKCNNCNERGHLMKDCPEPKKQPACILCGLRGHISRTCPESLCYNCNRPGHGARNCTEPRRSKNMECHRCFARGHIATECPDIWRQFHITTEPGPMCKGPQKENKSRFCFNCARKGHCAYECRESMMDSWKLPVTPFVTRYETKAAFVSSKHSKKRHSDLAHELPAKHMKPSHTSPMKKTSEQSKVTSEQRKVTSEQSKDFPRTPLDEYEESSEPRKKLTSKQENKRKWKTWQKKKKTEEQQRRLSLQQLTGYQYEAGDGGRRWEAGDSDKRDSRGFVTGRRSRQEDAAAEVSHGSGKKRQRSRSRRGGKGGGLDSFSNGRRHSEVQTSAGRHDRWTSGSHSDRWDPADYHDPWDAASCSDRHNSAGSRDAGRQRGSSKKQVHVTQRGFRMFRQ
ncbi:hypothetical protein LSAT2_013119 [Lamellibrachia satsuma]|nr:hypothetical protein LSAT2_013119 [Lamellibrachia satsuma]